ncbi:MAG: FAD-dependent oxidoreductase [Deltaproteobacteria bacterium]|nr:FAD-dependent oxidoreductase [Deltaproteobacteria bacterium]
MAQVKLTINGREIEAPEGATILEAAKAADIYIPVLCYHPDLPTAEGTLPAGMVYQGDRRIENAMPGQLGKGCGLCVVEVTGEADLVASCRTGVREGMTVVTENDRIRTRRQENLAAILARHRHACLTCAQQEGCSRDQCSSNVPENERCCTIFGHCELQDVVNYIGILPSTPGWIPTDLPIIDHHPLFVRDYTLCVGCTRCVRACRDLKGIEAIGFVYDENDRVQIGTLAPSLEESGCKFCTACVAVCPTGALMDKAYFPGKRATDMVPCRTACPVHMDVPAYLRLIAAGRREEARAVIREKVPFPGILGRVCIHPCEDVCRRGEVNAPLSICALKRYAADGENGLWQNSSAPSPDTGKKAAIVGSGPAGLTAAFYLRKKGHMVTVFEARPAAGGMMRYGIPSYRLPRDVLDKEIQDILDTGIEIRTRESLGKDFNLDRLKSVGFDAVFLAVGAQLSRRVSIDGSDLPGVLGGVDLLAKVAEGKSVQLMDRVIVIGGGDVAVDAARTALRCGAENVTMVCLEGRDKIPAHAGEIEGALAEGVKILSSWGARKILSRGDRITGVELVRCLRVLNEKGTFCPIFDDTTRIIEGDQVIMAIGQAADLSFAEGDRRLSVKRGLIVVDQDTLDTGMEGIYAGGDVVAMSGAIIHAIAAGRKAASSIDRLLGGTGDLDEILYEREVLSQYLGRDEGFALREREKVAEIALESRREGFREISLGLTDAQAIKEARRCLQCDLRLFLGSNPSPPERRVTFNRETLAQVPETEGVYRLFDIEKNVVAIKGTSNLRKRLLQELDAAGSAAWFDVEENMMYTQRESELIQLYMRAHGRMPGGGDSDLDDLF